MGADRISDDAVRKKTGKGWEHWFSLLDKEGAKKMDHKHIAKHLDSLGIPGWWCQMITVTYERERGLRKKYQVADGYSVSASRTFQVPVGTAYDLWSDENLRSRWLQSKPTVRKQTKDKSMRITWHDGTSVEVNFYAKGPDKVQVTVQHSKLANADDVERARARWHAALGRLSNLL